MAEEVFEDRRKALEEAFFKKQNQALLDRLRQAAQRESAQREIAQATGIKDPQVLARLVNLGFNAASLLAFALVPPVEVAWADGTVNEEERKTILARAAEEIQPGTAAHQMIASWLEHRPPRELFDAWAAFTRALCAGLSQADREWLAQKTLGRSAEVAEAAGGVLGLVLHKSRGEAEVIQRIEEAFGL